MVDERDCECVEKVRQATKKLQQVSDHPGENNRSAEYKAVRKKSRLAINHCKAPGGGACVKTSTETYGECGIRSSTKITVP